MTENINQKIIDEHLRMFYEICEQGCFSIDVAYALGNYKGKTIEQLIESENYPSLTKEKKDTAILSKALLEFALGYLEQSTFEYLIFEYKISEDAYINLDSQYKSKIVEDMFSKRKVNEELNIELEIKERNRKKLKV